MRRTGASQGEALATWGAWAVVLLTIVVTYARLEPAELYHVSREGLGGGLSRALVEVDFPVALVAIALVLVALDALPRSAWWVGGPAIALCAVVAWPGVVDQDDLDARWVNALPAIGLGLALALTVAAARRDGASFVDHARGDVMRLLLGIALVVIALPWLAAEAGFFFPGDVFMGEEVPPVRDEGIAAVHYGFHHGFGGVLLAVTALLLSRVPGSATLRAYLSLMLADGLANALQDAWNEQLWKRGTVGTHIADVIRPELSWGWLAIVAFAAAVYALWFRPSSQR